MILINAFFNIISQELLTGLNFESKCRNVLFQKQKA